MKEIGFALTRCQPDLKASCLNMHLGLSGGEERRQMEEKEGRRTRLKVTRGPENEGDGQEFRGRGQKVSKTWVISRQNTSPGKKDAYTQT